MTTEIPARPDSPDIGQRDADYLWENFYCAEAKHEHTVARVAVEALTEIAKQPWDGRNSRNLCARASEALAKIEASGWKP